MGSVPSELQFVPVPSCALQEVALLELHESEKGLFWTTLVELGLKNVMLGGVTTVPLHWLRLPTDERTETFPVAASMLRALTVEDDDKEMAGTESRESV